MTRSTEIASRGRRRVALIAPPWYPLPPAGYGGIEQVVALLARELRRRGHSVLLFGAAGSDHGTTVCAPAGWDADLGLRSQSVRELSYLARVFRRLRQAGQVDVVHDHSGLAGLLGGTLLDVAPVVHTVHGPIDDRHATFFEAVGPDASLVALSESQRSAAPQLPWAGTVHNAVDASSLLLASRESKEAFLLCLARICPDKGQHIAIEVARRTGRPLVLAGKVEATAEGVEYFRRHVEPHLDGRSIRHIGNAAGREKAELLARAHALLAPITWPEPFGLSVVEAMASGTPAVSFARGAAVELIEEGRTGFAVDGVDAMVEAVGACAGVEPVACASRARARFHPEVMADGYLRVYASVAGGGLARASGRAPAAEPSAGVVA